MKIIIKKYINKFKMESNCEDDYSDLPVLEFRNEREMNKEIEDILEITKDITTDWRKREAAIKRLGGIMLSNLGSSINFIKTFNQKLYLNLSIQMVDLRSSLMKEACRIVILAAKTYKEGIESAVEKLLSPLVLYKLVGTQNRVISDTGANCIMELVKNVESAKVITRINEQTKNKSSTVKLRLCQEMLYVLSNYSQNTLNKVITILEDFMHSMTHDASMEVRACARKIFFKYLELYQSNANKLLNTFDNNVQKTIIEENANNTSGSDVSYNSTTNSIATFHLNTGHKNKTLSVSHLNTTKPGHSTTKSGEINIKKTPETSPKKNGNSMNMTKPFSKTESKSILNKVNRMYGGDSVNSNMTNINNYNSSYSATKTNQITNMRSKVNIKKATNSIDHTNDEDYDTHHHSDKPKFKNIEDLIKSKINNLASLSQQDVTNKVLCFENISGLFNEIYSNIDYISKITLRNLILLHISNLAETNSKLAVQVMKNLTKFIFYLDDIFSEDNIFKITKIVILHISSDNELISQNANSLFEIMRKKIDSNLIIKPIVEIIDVESEADILEIAFEVMGLLIDVAVLTLSDQSYLNMFISRISIVLMKYESVLKFRILDTLEMIYRKYPKHFLISVTEGLLDSENKNFLFKLFESYKKGIFEYIKTYVSSQSNTENNVIKANMSQSNMLQTNIPQNFSQIKISNVSSNANILNSNPQNLADDNFDITEVNFEVLAMAASNETVSVLTYLKSDPDSNIENFILSLVKIKYEQVLPILTHIYKIVSSKEKEIFLDYIPLLINRIIHMLEKFASEYSDLLKEILSVISLQLDPEIFLQVVPKYITSRQAPHIVQILLITIRNVICSVDPESLLLLLPSFIETLFNTLNHHISDVRKLAVYCIVDIYFILGNDFETYLNELNPSQRNLINIYFKKKKESGK